MVSIVGMFLFIIIGIFSVAVIIKNGLNKKPLVISLFISCLILTFLIQGTPLYKMIGLIIIVPVAVYLMVDICLRLVSKNWYDE